MSEQGEGSTITSLEEVFLSREFGQASVRRGLPDGEFGDLPAAPQFEAVFVPEDFAAAPALEEVFLSEAFGRPEAVALRRRREAPLELIVPGDAVITPLHPTAGRHPVPGDRRRERSGGRGTRRGGRRVRRRPGRPSDRVRPGRAGQRARWRCQQRHVARPAHHQRHGSRRHHGGTEGNRWHILREPGREHGSGGVHGFAGRRGSIRDDASPRPGPDQRFSFDRQQQRSHADRATPAGGPHGSARTGADERRHHRVGAGHHRDEHGESDRERLAARGPGHGSAGEWRHDLDQHRPCDALADTLTIRRCRPPNWCAGSGEDVRFPPPERPLGGIAL